MVLRRPKSVGADIYGKGNLLQFISDKRIRYGSREKLCVTLNFAKMERNMLYPCASAGRDIELNGY